MNIEQVARMCHEANRAYCELIGDSSQVPWADAADWQRESAIAGVRAIVTGTAVSPESQHELWRQHKVADGWTYGDTKDPVAKTHPCMVPYTDLPEEQRLKDTLFRAVADALLS